MRTMIIHKTKMKMKMKMKRKNLKQLRQRVNQLLKKKITMMMSTQKLLRHRKLRKQK
jgi:hypothetical protein